MLLRFTVSFLEGSAAAAAAAASNIYMEQLFWPTRGIRTACVLLLIEKNSTR